MGSLSPRRWAWRPWRCTGWTLGVVDSRARRTAPRARPRDRPASATASRARRAWTGTPSAAQPAAGPRPPPPAQPAAALTFPTGPPRSPRQRARRTPSSAPKPRARAGASSPPGPRRRSGRPPPVLLPATVRLPSGLHSGLRVFTPRVSTDGAPRVLVWRAYLRRVRRRIRAGRIRTAPLTAQWSTRTPCGRGPGRTRVAPRRR